MQGKFGKVDAAFKEVMPKARALRAGPSVVSLQTLALAAADPRHEKRGDHRVTDAPVIYSVSRV